jgi:hypothetical protein
MGAAGAVGYWNVERRALQVVGDGELRDVGRLDRVAEAVQDCERVEWFRLGR